MRARPWCAALALLAGLVILRSAAAEPQMQAVVAVEGTPRLESVPKPQPAEGQVRIRVRAVSVNPVDWKLALRAPAGTRLTPGRDMAGIIDAVGPGADRWRAGDAVIAVAVGGPSGGSYAQYPNTPLQTCAPSPRSPPECPSRKPPACPWLPRPPGGRS